MTSASWMGAGSTFSSFQLLTRFLKPWGFFRDQLGVYKTVSGSCMAGLVWTWASAFLTTCGDAARYQSASKRCILRALAKNLLEVSNISRKPSLSSFPPHMGISVVFAIVGLSGEFHLICRFLFLLWFRVSVLGFLGGSPFEDKGFIFCNSKNSLWFCILC